MLDTNVKIMKKKVKAKIKPKPKPKPNASTSGRQMSVIEKAKEKMSSSLLRLMDESLYTNEADTMSLDKDKFVSYHQAYSKVSEKWPIKPIDYIVKFIKRRNFNKKPLHKLKFADIGCGINPLLKQKLPRGVQVSSFDLVSKHKDVTEANMISLPLESESIDCAVYSLSLMAKDLGKILLEAKRVLKPNGSLMIVEVTSRFEGKEKRFAGKLFRIGLSCKSLKSLPPNSYFTFFHFKKVDSETDYSASAKNIELKPCVYKTR